MRQRLPAVVAVVSLVAAASLAGCDKVRTVGATGVASTACTGCHGGLENATGAPPLDTRGNALTTVMTVGAHTSHVKAWLDCDACHVKPARVSAPGHMDGQVQVPFGQVARLHGAAPAFDPSTGLCSNVYCHGATLPVSARGLTTTPRWNGTTLAQPYCNFCHGQPGSSSGAPASHGAGPLDCSTCHPDTVLPGGEIKPPAQGGRHVDGSVDVNCTGCHGDRGRGETTDLLAAAPPVDTAGASTGAKVGAHLRHVSGVATLGSRLSSPFACTECHRVPTTVTASPPGHGITPVVQFGTAAAPAKNLGTTGGLVPVYSAATGGCATTYCHGASLNAGGTNHAPTWSATGAAACGTCHFQATTVASAPGHPQVDKAGAPFTSNAQCSGCHPGTVKADGTIDLALGNHVDGTVEATSPHPAGWLADHGNKAKLNLQGPGGCTSCHGAGFDTVVATSAAGKPESCNTCHANPADFIAGYTGQQHPSWRTECTFCHGDATLTRAAVATGPAAADAVGSPAANLVNAVLAAPERGSQGEMSATASAVGAHQRHASDSATSGNRLAYAFRCQECHGVNVLTDAAHTGVGHVDGQVVVGWQLAASRGATPAPAAGSYPAARDATGLARATPTSCTNYCHGATLSGGAASKTVTWTSPGTAGCGTCHGLPPDAPHPGVGAGTNCGGCHAGYDCTAANVAACTVNKPLHVNGVADVTGLTCTSCHGTAGVNFAPPLDTKGAATGVKVGAHQAHLTGANLRGLPLTCADCHTTPTSTGHATGTVDMTWGALARTGGLTPTPGNLGAATTPTQATWETTPTCTNYCHGQQWAGNANYAGSLISPRFTDTAALATACGSCHKAPPTSTAHGSVTSTTSCGNCHTGYTCTTGNLAACTVNTATHLNGALDTNLSCSSCHGTPGVNNAPPLDTKGAATGVKVGAHQKHVTGTSLRAALLTCADCHTTPTSTGHATGTVDMTWGALARTGGLTPAPGNLGAGTTPTQATWETTPTCTNYCHGQQWAGNANYAGSLISPKFTDTAALATACGSCHKAPPTSTAHGSVTSTTQCGSCHTGYTCTTGNLAACTVNKTTHINGALDTNLSCSSCHGTPGVNNAPPLDTKGAATGVKVGAHQKHVTGTSLRAALLTCADCHTTPTSTGHATGTVDMTWGALARTGGLTPAPGNLGAGTTPTQATWEATPTCTNYCHGQKYLGNANYAGSLISPKFTDTAALATACGSCHKAPPTSTAHGSVTSTTQCGSCHTGYTCTTGNLAACTVNKTTHINGALDTNLSCSSCHGTPGVNNAPPLDTKGAATGVKVGAHQKHVTGTSLRAALLTCADCHTTPTSTGHATGTVDMTWGALARTGGLTPAPGNLGAGTTPTQATWEATPTCTNYCHGQKYLGNANYAGSLISPKFTDTAALATACGSCHKAPPTSTAHGSVTSTTQCGSCHTGYTCTTGNLAACTVNKTTHINGVADINVNSCGACHGSATARTYAAGTLGPVDTANNLQGSPPNDTAGLATSNQVGPHLGHVTPASPGPQYYKPVLCSECHTTAVNTFSPTGHAAVSPKVQYPAGTAAALGGTVTSYVNNAVGTPDTCVTYCHGGSLTAAQKGAITTWQWTTGVTVACNSCHATPPRDPVHVSVATVAAATTGLSCVPCHNTTLSATGAILFTGTGTSAATLHIDGTRQNTAACNSCHGSATNNAPPVATNGTTTGVKVGAHQAHVVNTRLRTAALGCTDCHVQPTAMNHATGTVDMTWGTLAKTGALVPAPSAINATWEATPSCTNYCHGQKYLGNANYAGTTVGTVLWTGTSTSAACDSCHKAPPTSTAHASVTTTTQCGTCHTGYTCTTGNLAACTVNKTTHINGTVESSGTCIDCHTGAQGGRRAIVPEFTNSAGWSHKRSGGFTVTKYDCVVCHMEGNLTTGDPDPAYHPMTANGNIDLRDPDTGLHIKQVTFTAASGTSPGSYATTTTDMVFTKFSRNLGVSLEADPAAPVLQAIMVNQCLKCHDANGATAAFVPGGSAAKPFATTIAGANYTGAGVTAGGTLGGVTDVNASFATTNASYHPIRGKQNNSYVSALRMNAPWTGITKTGGVINTTAAWGYLISCWDCHAPLGTASTVTLTSTVTAHGGPTQLRQAVGVVNATNLCTVCHKVVPVSGASTSTHGAGSAWASGGNSTPGGIARTSCFRCHSSQQTAKAARPYAAQDVHGIDGFAPTAASGDTMWPVGTTNTYKPYAFFRSVGTNGVWDTTISWKPLSGPGVPTGAATCGNGRLAAGTCSSQNHGSYTPGGAY